MTNEITPSNIKNLSFKKQFSNYEDNLEKQSKLKQELVLVTKKLKLLVAPFSIGPALYLPESETPVSGSIGTKNTSIQFDEISPSTLKIFKPFIRNLKYDKLRQYKSVFSNLHSSEIKHILDDKFKGVAQYIDEVSDYLNDVKVREVDEEKTKELQDQYTALIKEYSRILADYEEVTTALDNMERYVDMAQKVSKINKERSNGSKR